jgi:hypothetical protein
MIIILAGRVCLIYLWLFDQVCSTLHKSCLAQNCAIEFTKYTCGSLVQSYTTCACAEIFYFNRLNTHREPFWRSMQHIIVTALRISEMSSVVIMHLNRKISRL